MTETELIKSSQQGSTSCFSQLVALYQPRLLSFLLVQCQNREDAEDAIQEAFINAFRHIKSYDSKWKFSTWLYTIARRAAIKKSNLLTDSIDENTELAQSSSGEIVEVNNIWIVIKPYLAPESFQVLWFFYAQDISIREIATIFERNISWVKVNLHRSREKLSSMKSVKDLFHETVSECE